MIYGNPLRDVVGIEFERVDQGVDYNCTQDSPLYAIGPGKVVQYFALGSDSGWPSTTGTTNGGAFIAYELTEGPASGKYVYLAENLTLNPALHVGSPVDSSTVVATLHNAQDFIETGWYGNNGTATLAAANGGYNQNGEYSTACGANFFELLTALGAPSGPVLPLMGTLPPGWPTNWKAAIAALSTVGMAATPSGKGYWLVTAAGGVSHFGDAGSYGSLTGTPASPVVGMAATAGGLGYWLVAADGAVFPFGNAKALSPSTSAKLPSPVVGMAATAIVSAKNEVSPGYWLAQADGTVTAYGAAVLHPGTKPSAGIVGIAAPPSGAGYWLVAADGGVFGYGVPDHGSMAGKHLNKPMVGMAATPDGLGYWLVAADGGIFNYGSALLEGSEGNKKLNAPVVGMAPAPLALATAAKPQGYWLVAADGGIFSFGDAPFSGSGG